MYYPAESPTGDLNNNFKPYIKSLSPLVWILHCFEYTKATYQAGVLAFFKVTLVLDLNFGMILHVARQESNQAYTLGHILTRRTLLSYNFFSGLGVEIASYQWLGAKLPRV